MLLFAACSPVNLADQVAEPAALDVQMDLGEDFEAVLEAFRWEIRNGLVDDVAAVKRGVGMGGVTMAVGLDGELVWTESYGWADSVADRTADVHTRYRIASITKMVTTAMFFQQIEEGQVALDDPVHERVPEVLELDAPDPDAITWRHALSHTAGFDWDTYPEWKDRLARPDDWDARFLESLVDLPLERAAGEAYAYSNVGPTLVGIASARIDGTSWSDVLRTRTLEPLDLAETTLNFEAELGAPYARGYERQHNPKRTTVAGVDHEAAHPEFAVPAHRLYASASDVVRLAAAFDPAHGWLGQAAFDEMSADINEPYADTDPGWFYGLGTWSHAAAGSDVIAHSGDWPGFETILYVHPDTGLSVVLLRNYNGPTLANSVYGWQLMEDLLDVFEPPAG